MEVSISIETTSTGLHLNLQTLASVMCSHAPTRLLYETFLWTHPLWTRKYHLLDLLHGLNGDGSLEGLRFSEYIVSRIY